MSMCLSFHDRKFKNYEYVNRYNLYNYEQAQNEEADID